jgi:hypothetical protein
MRELSHQFPTQLFAAAVQHDQAVDRDAGLRIDQERIDVNRGDALALIIDPPREATEAG